MLQQQDVDALIAALQGSQSGAVDRVYSEVKIYDFSRPDNLPSEFIRALDNANASFARTIAGMLTGQLSQGVQVEPLSNDQMSYRQFCHSVPETTAIAVFNIAPMEGAALLELNPHVAWFLIDRGLGGAGEVLETAREFTALEKGLLDDLFRRILRELAKAWESMLPLKPMLREILTNATIARVAQPDDRMVICSFGITIGDVSGMMSYGISVTSLDFDRILGGPGAWEGENPDDLPGVAEQRLQERLLAMPMQVRACFAEMPVSLRELASLEVGDIVTLDVRVDDPVELRVEDALFGYARPLTLGEQLAIEITSKEIGEHHGGTL